MNEFCIDEFCKNLNLKIVDFNKTEIYQIANFLDISDINNLINNNVSNEEILQKLWLIIEKFFETNSNLVKIKQVKLDEETQNDLLKKLRIKIADIFQKNKEQSQLQSTLLEQTQSIQNKNYTKLLRHHAIYEIYKVINPKRLAGQTKKQNFINNMLIGGLNRARKYAGGRDHEINSYDKKYIEKLQTDHEKIKKNNRLI